MIINMYQQEGRKSWIFTSLQIMAVQLIMSALQALKEILPTLFLPPFSGWEQGGEKIVCVWNDLTNRAEIKSNEGTIASNDHSSLARPQSNRPSASPFLFFCLLPVIFLQLFLSTTPTLYLFPPLFFPVIIPLLLWDLDPPQRDCGMLQEFQ